MMMMRLCAVAALVALAAPAAAQTAVVDGTKFRYAVPDGYCSLDLNQSGHRQLFEQTASKIAAQDLKLVVGFNTCMELAALGAKAPRNAAPDGMISVLARSGKQVARLGLSRREFLGHIRERHKPVDWGAAETELEALAEGEGKLVRLGILGEDDRAVYVGTALRSSGGVYANLVAFTLAEGRAFQISLTRPLEGRASFETLLSQERAMVAALRP
ncbi:MAG TPA: hypothetical protein VLE26_05390 [Alphaproteobacteria bacterium]|jgi:hypothetical protein|nr:hypothetical protein [Alphaproteobacteria bacterium]